MIDNEIRVFAIAKVIKLIINRSYKIARCKENVHG